MTLPFRSLLSQRKLIFTLAKRDVAGRYKGSIMGLAWSFFNPLLLLIVYTFMFTVIFKSKWQGIGKANVALVIFVGMTVHGLLAECVNRAPTLIASNINFVKKVIFPLEILPAVTLLSAMFHMCISFVVFLIAEIILMGSVPWTALLIPLILLPLALGTLGLSWFLSSLGVFARDIGQLTGLLMTVLMFLSPVFFPREALPPAYRVFLDLNPLAFVIESARQLLIYGQLFSLTGWCLSLVEGLIVFVLGYWWFNSTKAAFADVL